MKFIKSSNVVVYVTSDLKVWERFISDRTWVNSGGKEAKPNVSPCRGCGCGSIEE